MSEIEREWGLVRPSFVLQKRTEGSEFISLSFLLYLHSIAFVSLSFSGVLSLPVLSLSPLCIDQKLAMASSSATPSTSSTSTTPPVVDYKSERDVIDAYTRLRQELSGLADRVQDLEAQLSEHALVAKTMRPMEKGRKAFRLVRLFFPMETFFV